MAKERNPEFVKYANDMAKLIATQPKRQVTTAQAASTLSTLQRDPKDDATHISRPDPIDWKRDHEERREIPTELFSIVDRMRKGSKNTTGDFMSAGLSSVSKERRDLAIQAFTYSPPAELTQAELAKVKKLESLETVDAKIEKLTLMQKVADVITGLFTGKKASVKKDSIGHVLYKASGGNDKDLDIHD